jgi:uncharacterized protein
MPKWNDKIVAITGGSAGLGLALAKEFGRRGAKPILISRSQENLERAIAELTAEQVAGEYLIADVLNEAQIGQAIARIAQRHGRIDAWINNVGRSIRIDMAQASPEHYRELLEVNLISAITCTRLVLPHLEKTAGHLVNIGSLSSKTAWPFLAPYTTSKFALAGYTQQLRIEGPRNVHYLLACPGPIKRNDAGLRYNGGGQQLPGHALQPGAGAKIEGLSAATVARGIVRACERRRAEVVMPFRARILFAIAAFSPRLADWILRKLIG